MPGDLTARNKPPKSSLRSKRASQTEVLARFEAPEDPGALVLSFAVLSRVPFAGAVPEKPRVCRAMRGFRPVRPEKPRVCRAGRRLAPPRGEAPGSPAAAHLGKRYPGPRRRPPAPASAPHNRAFFAPRARKTDVAPHNRGFPALRLESRDGGATPKPPGRLRVQSAPERSHTPRALITGCLVSSHITCEYDAV